MPINRDRRASIAQETLAVMDRGSYHNLHAQEVSIAAALALAKAQSVHYSSQRLAEFSEAPLRAEARSTQFEVRNESTLAAARRIVGAGRAAPLCLNFASAKNPGGGFLGGSEAQEENLAKSSGLYACIVQMNGMYDANRALRSCIYNDDMIYSPNVPVFRDDAYGFLDAPYLASFVTAPAVNRGALSRKEPERMQDVEACMLRRIDKLLALALHHGHTELVLGAWGCGVFGNLPTDMARWFGAHLLHNPRYATAFGHVTFAVPDRRESGTFVAFDEVFGQVRHKAGGWQHRL